MSIIFGKYLDGKISKEHPIKIYLDQNNINFSLLENKYSSKNQNWSINEISFENNSSKESIIFSYGDSPKQSILINDKESIALIKNKYPNLIKHNFFNTIFGNYGIQITIAAIALVFLFLGIFYQLIFPFLTTKIVQQIPIQTEITLGNKMVNSFLLEMETMPNSINKEKTILINEFYKKTNFKSNYPIKIYFVNDSLVNAFAIPGGTIFVYKGIIDKIQSSNELAALLGHEIAHIQKRHSLISLTKGLANYLFLSLVTSDVSGVLAVLIDNVMMLKNLSNSRDFEKEADLESLNYLITNNLSSTGVIDLMKHLNKSDKKSKNEFDSQNSLSYFSTHPSSIERINYIKKDIKDRKITINVFPIKQDLEAIFSSIKTK